MNLLSNAAETLRQGLKQKHSYVMMFRASERGLAKRVEFCADDVSRAVEFALADRARRTVDVLENGQFLCRISRDEPVNPAS